MEESRRNTADYIIYLMERMATKDEIESIRNDISELRNMLLKDNGRRSFSSRINNLESDMEDVKSFIDKYNKRNRVFLEMLFKVTKIVGTIVASSFTIYKLLENLFK